MSSSKRFVLTALCGAGLLGSGMANAMHWYRILDHNGVAIIQTYADAPWGQASFTAAGCMQVDAGLNIECQRNSHTDSPPLRITSTGVRGCILPFPFIQLDSWTLCFNSAYYVQGIEAAAAPGTPRCAEGVGTSLDAPCVRPFRFEFAPTAPAGLVLAQVTVAFGDSGFDGPTEACEEPTGSATCTVFPPADGVTKALPYVTVVYAPPVSCSGFQAPFDTTLDLRSGNQAIPLKAQIFDPHGNLLTPETLGGSVPVVEVSYSDGTRLPVRTKGHRDAATTNQFSFDATTGTWNFILDSSPYTLPGTYTVGVAAGEGASHYAVMGCSGSFIR